MNLYPDTYKLAARLYQKRGLPCTPPKGNNRWGKHMVCAAHDGVPYCMNSNDMHGNLDPSKAEHNLLHRKLTIQRHHAQVKAVYEYLCQQGLGDIWAMCGGGAQLQVFFGTEAGYVAILYLSLDYEAEEHSEYVRDLGEDPVALVVQSARNDAYFRDFDVPGITLRTYADVYGNNDVN